jgi:hypothetical protein
MLQNHDAADWKVAQGSELEARANTQDILQQQTSENGLGGSLTADAGEETELAED